MNSSSKLFTKCILIAGVIAGLVGWKSSVTRAQDVNPDVGGGNAGTLIVPIDTSKPNTQTGCFPTGNGWNAYFVLTNYFVGPLMPTNMSYYSTDLHTTNIYLNTYQQTNVIITTCDPNNGTNLETGIVIQNVFNPNTDYICATNSSCSSNTNLSTAEKLMSSSTSESIYRVSIVFNTNSLSGLTNITVDWSYSN